MYDDGRTWRDYFMDEARSELSQMTALCAWADANGVTLTDEEIAEVDDSIATLDSSAREGGSASGDKYFSANYGTGVTSAPRMAEGKTTVRAHTRSAPTRRNSVTVQGFTDDEISRWKIAAGELGIDFPTWCRDLLRDALNNEVGADA